MVKNKAWRSCSLAPSYLLLACFSCYILLSHCEDTNECLESKLLSIPVCHPGANCVKLPFSYSCAWSTKFNYTFKSPYISLDSSIQLDIPMTWHLPVDLPLPANECLESVLEDKHLCQVDAICEDQPRGYKCYYLNIDKNNATAYINGACEAVDKNWICPFLPNIEPESPAEKAIEEIEALFNETKSMNVSNMTVPEVVHTVDLIMNASQKYINVPVNDSQVAKEVFVNTVKLFDQSILNLVHKLQSESSTQQSYSFQKDSINVLLEVLPRNKTQIDQKFGQDTISLALSPKKSDKSNLIISFTSIYRNSSILSAMSNASSGRNPITDVVGITVYENVSLNLLLRMNHQPLTKENEQFRHCGYWRPEDAANNLTWSYDGCFVNASASGSDYTTCQCNHLTYYSVIFDLKRKSRNETDEIPKPSGDVLTAISCTICILALTILLICMWKLGLILGAFIQFFVCLCLLLGNLTFLIGMYMVDVSARSFFCPMFAILSVYWFMTAFSFKFIYGFQLIRSVLRSYHAGPTSNAKRMKLTVLGFSVPLIIVVISVAVRSEDFGTDEASCWIKVGPNYTILSFFIPVLLVIVFNAVNLCLLTYKLLSNRRERQKLHRGKVSLNHPGCSFNEFVFLTKATLCMGITWISGFMVNIEALRPSMEVIFPFFNALQGIALLIHLTVSKKNRGLLSSFISQITSSDSSKGSGRSSILSWLDPSQRKSSAAVSVRESTAVPSGKRVSSSQFDNSTYLTSGRESTVVKPERGSG